MFPPIPFRADAFKDYREQLTKRFAAHARDSVTKAEAAVESLTSQCEKDKRSEGSSSSHAESVSRAEDLLALAKNLLDVAKVNLSSSGGLEAAADYVQRSIDLQIGKGGGLLAFNGLVIAVGTVLWTTTDPIGISVALLLFFCMLCSSTLTLLLVLAWWSNPSDYGSASSDLAKSLQIGAWRAWALNIAVLLSITSVLLLAFWIAVGKPKPVAPITVNGVIPVTVNRAPPVTVIGTVPVQVETNGLTLRCTWNKPSPIKKNDDGRGTFECRATPGMP
jgi:hypothetical protein